MNIDSRENKIQFIKNIFIHRKYVSSEELKSSYFQEYQTDDLYEFTSELTKLKFFEFDDSDFVKRQPSKLSSSRLGESDTIPRNSLIKYQDIKTGKYLTLHDARAIQSRRGQEKFRDDVLSRDKKCLVTGCEIKDILEAAHILPHSEGGSMETENGITLRSDIHTLFDLNKLVFIEKGSIASPIIPQKLPNGHIRVSTTGKTYGLEVHLHPDLQNDAYYDQYHEKFIPFINHDQIDFEEMDKRCRSILENWEKE